MQEMLWTMVMFQVAVVGRASLLTYFCPDLSDIYIPSDNANIAADGLPKRIFITLRRWKGNEEGLMPPQEIVLRRNMANPEFCIVLTLMAWLSRAGITSGQIFPAMNKGHTDLYHGYTNQSPCYRQWLKTLFKTMPPKYHKGTSHSIRKTTVKWAARCGKQTPSRHAHQVVSRH